MSRVLLDDMVWSGELVGEQLGQCSGLVIRWKKSLFRDVHGHDQDRASSSRRQNFMFSTAALAQYGFHENGRDSNLEDMSPATPIDSSNPEGSSPMTHGSESSVGNLQDLDGFAPEGPRRRYSIETRRRRMPNPRERGEPRSLKGH